MSNEDISMVCNILLGITNVDKEIRMKSVNKLLELSNNLGALTFCLIEIASKNATNEKERIIKITALVICRKILTTKKEEDWKKINNDLKEKIKINILILLNKEIDPSLNSKICDLIVEIINKVLESKEEWPQLISLALSICNYDPRDNSKITQIRTLLKLLTGGIGYIYSSIAQQYNNLIPYLGKLLDSEIDMKIKAIEAGFICELISYSDENENKLFNELIKKIFDNIYKCYLMNEKMPEDCVKSILENIINAETMEFELFIPLFPKIFSLCQKLIEKKDYVNEKIRELAFEVILNLVEEKPSLFKSKKKYSNLFYPFLEMIFNYALEFNKNYDSSWEIPPGNVYDKNVEDSYDDKISFALYVINRIIECMDIEGCENEIQNILDKFLKNSWEYQYFALLVLANYSEQDEEITKVENIFPIIYNSTSHSNPKLRFSAVHCLHIFSINYNPSFQSQTIKDVIPLLMNLLKKEKVLRIQCEIVESIISFLHFTTSYALKPYVKELFELLFIIFKNNIPIIIRKLILEAILEIITTMEQEISPFAPIAFDIIIQYFSQSYKYKANQILYGPLIECATSLGIYVEEKYYKFVPELVNNIIEIVKGFNMNKYEPIRADLTNSLERLLPVLQKNFKNLLPKLIETVLTLIKLRPKVAISSTPNEQFDINKLLDEDDEKEEKKKEKEIITSETEDLATSLSLLNTIIESMEDDFLSYVDAVESEVVQLVSYKADSKVRTKSAKILPNLLLPIKEQNLKINKAKYYVKILIDAIEKEKVNHVCEKFFTHLKEVIENGGQFLNEEELNMLFAKITDFFNNLKIKRNNLISNKKSNINKDKENNFNIGYLGDKKIQELENIQSEISDIIGKLLKTHRQIAGQITEIILKNIIPSYINSQNLFEVKMGLYIADDLIEFIGQDILGEENWTLMYNIITKLVINKDMAIRHAAAYGIGNFAKYTTHNFDKYSKGLIDGLYNGMNIKKEEEKENKEEDEEEEEEYNDFGMAYDNMVASLGKIINYQFKSEIVQAGLNELITKWIMNLPIKYDDTEQELQHSWLVELFLVKKNLISENCYSHYFETLAKIYETKSVNDKTNEKIKYIFNEFVKKDEKNQQIINTIYQNSDEVIKRKLEKLIK